MQAHHPRGHRVSLVQGSESVAAESDFATRDSLRSNLYIFLLAGHETTANSL